MDPNPLAQLDGALRTYFLTQYGSQAGPVGTAFVAFQPGGIPLSPSMFQVGQPAAFSEPRANEIVSGLTDIVGPVVGGELLRTLQSVSGLAQLVAAARPAAALTEEDKSFLNSQISDAGRALDAARAVSYQGLYSCLPVTSSPRGWYEPATPCWTSFEFSSTASESTSTTAGAPQTVDASSPGGAEASPPVEQAWQWRVLPASRRAIVEDPRVIGDLTIATQALADAVPIEDRLRRLDQLEVTTRVATVTGGLVTPIEQLLVAAAPTEVSPPPPVARVAARGAREPRLDLTPRPVVANQVDLALRAQPAAVLDTLESVVAETTTQHVSTSKVTVRFEHCLVLVGRPWFKAALLVSPGWYVPLHQHGALAPGGPAAVSYPIGMIVIRNLELIGQWSEQDLASASSALSLGPLSLVGRTVTEAAEATTATIRVPGMQVAGWICLPLPELAPNDAPVAVGVSPS